MDSEAPEQLALFPETGIVVREFQTPYGTATDPRLSLAFCMAFRWISTYRTVSADSRKAMIAQAIATAKRMSSQSMDSLLV